MTPATPTALHGLTLEELRAFARELGEPLYRGNQLFEWLWRRRVDGFEPMTNLPAALRERLAERASVALPRIASDRTAADGTRKLLLAMEDGAEIECVLIPDGARLTLCLSTQVGCALACRFCATGLLGFKRNLTPAEILAQVLAADRLAREAAEAAGAAADPRRLVITHIVLMGMGEPMLNREAVAKALAILRDRRGLDLSPQRVTLSTVGVLDNLWELIEETGVNLAISLHAPDAALRRELMPIERAHPLEEILRQVRARWRGSLHNRVTFEYVLLDGVNDSPEQAAALARQLEGLACKVNLLPFNPHPGAPYGRPSDERVERFRAALVRHGVDAYVRRSRGRDIAAACGQLALQPDEQTPVTPLRPRPRRGAPA